MLSEHHEVCLDNITQWVKVDCLAMAWLGANVGLKSPGQLTTCHKAFVVSGTRVHFGCCGDQSPSGQQSMQWEPQTAVLSLLGLISVAYPLYYLDRSIKRPPQPLMRLQSPSVVDAFLKPQVLSCGGWKV